MGWKGINNRIPFSGSHGWPSDQMDGWSHLNSDSWCHRIGLAEETTGETTGMRFAPRLYQINVFDYSNSEDFTFTESPPQGCSCWGLEGCLIQMKVLASDGPGRLLCTRLARLRTWPRFVPVTESIQFRTNCQMLSIPLQFLYALYIYSLSLILDFFAW